MTDEDGRVHWRSPALGVLLCQRRRKPSRRHFSRDFTPEEWAERARRRDRARSLARYGLSLDDYERLYVEQRGVCAVCKTPPDPEATNPRLRVLHVDHCHETGRVRGLLCFDCNLLVGRAHDDPDRCLAAAAYLYRAVRLSAV